MKRFLRIKQTRDGKVRIEYQQKNQHDWDEYTLLCADKPKQEFEDALQELVLDVIEMCELPPDYRDRITISGVKFSYAGDDEIMGATITASMRLRKSSGVLNLNTPHKASAPYNANTRPEDIENQLLSPDCVDALHNLQAEAEAYIRGERAQGDMFAGKEKELQEATA